MTRAAARQTLLGHLKGKLTSVGERARDRVPRRVWRVEGGGGGETAYRKFVLSE